MSYSVFGFLNIGSAEGAERGEDLVRLRLQSLVQIVYFFVLIFLAVRHRAGLIAGISIAALIIQLLVFWSSYRDKTGKNRLVFTFVMAAFSVIMTGALGTGFGFQFFLYTSLILLLLDSHISYGSKVIFCTLSVLSIVTLHAVNHLHGPLYRIFLGDDVSVRLIVFNELAIAFNIIILGLSYARYQVEAERQLYLANQKLKLAADTDLLTRLPNRRAILEVLNEIDESKNETISIAMGDIDHFKNVNDTYGHDAGDAVLRNVATQIMRFMDHHGYCARWGGEEFLLVFTDTNGDDAYMLLDNFRRELAKTVTRYDESEITVTMTFGVEEHGFFQTTEKTIKNADAKLYTGKETGRNKVVY